MITVLDNPAREIKGTNDRGNYHFFIQKAKLTSVDRDGIEEVRVFEVQSNPGETYEPGSDYLIDPSSCYIGRTDKGRERLMVGASPKLVRLSKLAADLGKPAALKAA